MNQDVSARQPSAPLQGEARIARPSMSRLASLPVEHQRFIEMFVLSGGNLKEIAEQVGVSYPTIRSRLDKVIESLRNEIGKTRRVKGNVLDAVEPSTGKVNAEEAARLIKGI